MASNEENYVVFAVLLIAIIAVPAPAQTPSTAIAPATVIHIINVKWKEDATPEADSGRARRGSPASALIFPA